MVKHDVSPYMGSYHEGGGGMFERCRLVRTYSMDLQNDPRFFQDNVINYRLNAFASLSVVSSLLLGVAQADIFAMNKNMSIFLENGHLDRDGILQLMSFILLSIVFIANVLATYIGVAQPYHTYRLMTSGPMGFETAASYYLNKNIIAFRHLAIKSMLWSLPIFMLQCGFRTIVKFSRGTAYNIVLGNSPPATARIEGIVSGSVFIVIGLFVYYIHVVHFTVFREQYRIMATYTQPAGFTNHMASIMTPRATAEVPDKYNYLDV